MTSVAEWAHLREGPRAATVEVRDRHLRQRVFLAVADGLCWDVIPGSSELSGADRRALTVRAARYLRRPLTAVVTESIFPKKLFPVTYVRFAQLSSPRGAGPALRARIRKVDSGVYIKGCVEMAMYGYPVRP